MENAEKEEEGGRERENCLVLDSRPFFQSVLEPAHFAPPKNGSGQMNSFFVEANSSLVEIKVS